MRWIEVADDEFGRVDVPHFVCGAGWHQWLIPPDVGGCAYWGAIGVRDFERIWATLVQWMTVPGVAPFDIVADHLEPGATVDPAAARRAVELAIPNVPLLVRLFRRQALIMPADFDARLLAAMNEQLGLTFPVRRFETRREALTWLGRPDAGGPVERLGGAVRERIALARRVKGVLTDSPGLGIDEVARALGMSRRTLQRRLGRHATSFAELRAGARIDLVFDRLRDSDDKVDSLVALAGFESPGAFFRWFKRLTGVTPAQWRATERSGARVDVARETA